MCDLPFGKPSAEEPGGFSDPSESDADLREDARTPLQKPKLAEGVRFEPSVPLCGTHAFEAKW